MKILWITNYPAPYRVDFFNELGKQAELTVAFLQTPEEQRHRNSAWFLNKFTCYKTIYLKTLFRVGSRIIIRNVVPLLKMPFDFIIFGDYSDITCTLAIEYLRLHKIPFFLEVDGGFIKEDNVVIDRIKHHFIGSASGWFSTGAGCNNYLEHYGAEPKKTYRYPFTSLHKVDILTEAASFVRQNELRKILGMGETPVIISVGQFIHRKGFDLLLQSACTLRDVDFYFVGGTPTEEYLNLRQENHLENVHFIGFCDKEKLKEYYQASDIFVLPTREDIWGLVINEAMANGLPVISTNRCLAALELVKDGENGFIVPINDVDALTEKILFLVKNQDLMKEFGKNSLLRIRDYTIENMARIHLDIFRERLGIQ